MNLIERLRTNRSALQAEVDAIIAAAEERAAADPAADMTDEELAQVRDKRTQIASLTVRIEEELEAEQRRANATASDQTPAEQRTPAQVTAEPRTYTRESERRGVSFVRDVFHGTLGSDFGARSRLERHMTEARVEGELVETRDVGTGAFAGLTVPQYLTDLVAPLARAARPFADVCRSIDLPPDGMTVNISRITTGAAVAAQATENAAVQETDMDDTLLTVNVRTIAGQQDVSRQSLDRSTGVDEIVVADLVAAYHAELDRQALLADGTSGTHLGLINVAGNIGVTYTDATPTAAELYPKLADLIQQIQAAVYMGVTHFVMHPRRWWWIAKELGSTFPLLTIPGAGIQQAGTQGNTDYAGMGRSIMGVPVILDGNIATNLGAGTNEDVIFGITASECFLWEQPSSPLLIRAEQTAAGSLTVKLVVYGYSAFTGGRRPTANGTIEGTGLVTPTF